MEVQQMPYRYLKLPELTEQDINRFWKQVSQTPGQGPNGDCWIWTGYHNGLGYGRLSIKGRMRSVTRLAYFIKTGTDPIGFHVLHECDCPPCVRHLFIGTQADNLRDMKKKGRGALGDRNGSRKHPESRAVGKRHGSKTHPESRPIGERVHNAILTTEQVLKIRAAKDTHQSIANQYQISRVTVTDIKSRKTWKHLP
jgi:hypothetical protein